MTHLQKKFNINIKVNNVYLEECMHKKKIEDIFEYIQDLSTIEIAQLKNMIDREVMSLNRANEIRMQLNKGSDVEFFCPTSNKFITGKIFDIKQKYAVVFSDNNFYEIPLFSIKTGPCITSEYKRLSKHTIKTDQIVGFKDKSNNIVAAKVIRINDKSVTLIDQVGMKWRVSYALLFDITDNDKARVIMNE